MTSPLDNGNRWAALGVAVFLLGLGAVVADSTPAVALVNESPSLPRGLYLRQAGAEPGVGSVVAIPQPQPVRPYLADLGMPAEVLLIKRVAAGDGDLVCRDRGSVWMPGRSVVARASDSRGVALPAWSGCRHLGPGDLFLLGDTPGSFDSRYFGSVPRTAITGVYQEILTW